MNASSVCSTSGVNYLDGGDYFINTNSNQAFTIVSTFSGCNNDTADVSLVNESTGDQYDCGSVLTVPNGVPQTATCLVLKSQFTSGTYLIITVGNNGNGQPFAYQRQITIRAGTQQTITRYSTATTTITPIITVNCKSGRPKKNMQILVLTSISSDILHPANHHNLQLQDSHRAASDSRNDQDALRPDCNPQRDHHQTRRSFHDYRLHLDNHSDPDLSRRGPRMQPPRPNRRGNAPPPPHARLRTRRQPQHPQALSRQERQHGLRNRRQRHHRHRHRVADRPAQHHHRHRVLPDHRLAGDRARCNSREDGDGARDDCHCSPRSHHHGVRDQDVYACDVDDDCDQCSSCSCFGVSGERRSSRDLIVEPFGRMEESLRHDGRMGRDSLFVDYRLFATARSWEWFAILGRKPTKPPVMKRGSELFLGYVEQTLENVTHGSSAHSIHYIIQKTPCSMRKPTAACPNARLKCSYNFLTNPVLVTRIVRLK